MCARPFREISEGRPVPGVRRSWRTSLRTIAGNRDVPANCFRGRENDRGLKARAIRFDSLIRKTDCPDDPARLTFSVSGGTVYRAFENAVVVRPPVARVRTSREFVRARISSSYLLLPRVQSDRPVIPVR